MSDAHYHEHGYTILRKRICEHDIVELLELVSAMDLGARKPNLLDNTRLRQRVDQLIKPLFREAGISVNALVELHALAALHGKAVKLGWHKDLPVDGGIHAFQLPLLDGDVFHELVPASHDREPTDSQIAARNAGGENMPGAIRVELDAGDILLRNAFIFHRGYNPSGQKRLTIVGTYAQK